MAQKLKAPARNRVPTGVTAKVLGPKHPNDFVPVEHLRVEEGPEGAKKEKVYTRVNLKDSGTFILFGLSKETGRYAVLVRDEFKFIPGRDITTATGSGYTDRADKGQPTAAGARKAERESGLSWDTLKVVQEFDFTGGVGAYAYPQNIVGRHFYTGALVEEFPLQKESRGGWLLDLFPSRETVADADALAEYRARSQEHEVLLVAMLFARTYLLGEGLCNKYGEPTV